MDQKNIHAGDNQEDLQLMNTDIGRVHYDMLSQMYIMAKGNSLVPAYLPDYDVALPVLARILLLPKR